MYPANLHFSGEYIADELNNQKTEKGVETKGMSIMEKLVESKEKIEKQSQRVKEAEKKSDST